MKSILMAALLASPLLLAQEPQRNPKDQIFYFAQPVGPLAGKAVTGAPYSADAVTESTQTLADGNRIVHNSTTKLYRDGQGRERREESLPALGNQGQAPSVIFLSDPVAQASYTLNPEKHTAQKMPFGLAAGKLFNVQIGNAVPGTVGVSTGGRGVAGIEIKGGMILPGGSSSNSNTEQLGSQTIEGLIANGTRTTVTIPAGQIGNERPIEVVDEVWYSPYLQLNVMTKHSDPRAGETVYRLTNINRAEPDPSLFQVPPDYTVNEAPRPEIRLMKQKLQ